MFISYPMLGVFNYSSGTIYDIIVTSTHPLWSSGCKKIKKNNSKSFGVGNYTQNGDTNIIVEFKDDKGIRHEFTAIKDFCMKGMPKVKVFIKDGADGDFVTEFKSEF